MNDSTDPEVNLIAAVVAETERKGVGPAWGLAITEAVAAAAPHIAELGRAGDADAIERALGYLVSRAKATKVAHERAATEAKTDKGPSPAGE